MKKIFTGKACWVAGTLFVGGLLGLSFFVGEFSKPHEGSSEVVRRNVARKSVLASGVNLVAVVQEQPMELSIGTVQLEKERLGPFLLGAFNVLVLDDVSIRVIVDSATERSATRTENPPDGTATPRVIVDSATERSATNSDLYTSVGQQEKQQELEAILHEQLMPLLPKGIHFSGVNIHSFDICYVWDGREIPVFYAKTAKLNMKQRSLTFFDATFKDEHLREQHMKQCSLALLGSEVCVERRVGVTSLKHVAKVSLN